MFRRLILTVICAFAPSAAFAGDFPGIGDPSAWSDALPYYNRGNRYLSQQRYEDAVRDFQEAVSKYKYDADFYVNLGVALRKIEDYKGAEQAFKSALKLKPKDWMAWSNLGNAYLKQDRLKDTISAFEQALKCNPPAAEKTAMLQDIVDIHKLLRATGQEPLPVPPGTKSTAKSKPKPVAKSAPPPKPVKDWGYD
jgi:tetratricopeptide (TPR) repeat protein